VVEEGLEGAARSVELALREKDGPFGPRDVGTAEADLERGLIGEIARLKP